MSGTVVNINGVLFDKDSARVSVFDRGFLYGDSIYEVLRTYGGNVFDFDGHADRLWESAEALGMPLSWDRKQLRTELARTLDAAGNDESYIRVVVTRGAGEIGLDPALAVGQQTLIVIKPLTLPTADFYARGISAIVPRVRRNLRDALDPAIKSGNYLNNILALHEAIRAGAQDAIMLDHRGLVTEGTTANVWIGRNGRLVTPPLSVGILAGITRRHVLRLAPEGGLTAEEADFDASALRAADEIFFTSSIKEIVPVTRLDGRAVGGGTPGPLTRRVSEIFQRYTNGLRARRDGRVQ